MADTSNFRNGFTIKLDGDLFAIAEFQHVKPGKGGAFVRTRLKNVRTGAVIDRTVRSGDKVEEIRIERRASQFLYAEGDDYHFMDTESYEQNQIPRAVIGDGANLLKENETVDVLVAEERPIGVELPNFVEIEVTQTDPGIRGDTATGAVKPAKLATGATVSVPLFINQGDVLRIDTRTGAYVTRV